MHSLRKLSRRFNDPQKGVTALAALVLAAWLLWMLVIYARFSQPTEGLREFTPVSIEHLAKKPKLSLGMHIESVTDFDPVKNTFKAEGTTWAKWSDDVEKMVKGNPFDSLYFANSIDDKSGIDSDIEDALLINGNQHYQYAEFSGTFKNAPIQYRSYPFGNISLSIKVESDDFEVETLVLSPENEASGYSESIEIAGYKPTALNAQGLTRKYSTGWGLDAGENNYPVVEYTMTLSRSIWIGVWRQLFPIFVIISIAILSMYLPSDFTRVSFAPGLLLSLVFLQGRQYGDLPPSADAWTYLAKIFICGYLIVLYTFIEGIRSVRISDKDELEVFERATGAKAITLVGILCLAILL